MGCVNSGICGISYPTIHFFKKIWLEKLERKTFWTRVVQRRICSTDRWRIRYGIIFIPNLDSTEFPARWKPFVRWRMDFKRKESPLKRQLAVFYRTGFPTQQR